MNKRKRAEELIRYLSGIRDKEGYAVVDIDLSDEEAIFDPFGYGEERDLNGAIYDSIESQTNVIPAQIPLRIRFHGDVAPDRQEKIVQAMRRHDTLRLLDVSWDLAANFRKAFFLILFGVAVLSAYFYFSLTSDHFFWAEILSIVGSFSLWEAADALLLERPRLRREGKNIRQSLEQRVEFIPLTVGDRASADTDTDTDAGAGANANADAALPTAPAATL